MQSSSLHLSDVMQQNFKCLIANITAEGYVHEVTSCHHLVTFPHSNATKHREKLCTMRLQEGEEATAVPSIEAEMTHVAHLHLLCLLHVHYERQSEDPEQA